MIDTITLSIPVTNMDIDNLSQFNPDASNIFTTDRGFRRYGRNPTSHEKQTKVYVPIYTLFRRYRKELEIELQIQVSIPKLKFGNNFQEVLPSDFADILDRLERIMLKHGFNISKVRLANAKVSGIHFSKNILLSEGLNCSMLLNQIYKALDVNHQKDFSQVKFKNGGQILHINTNDSDFAMYDKMRELERSKVTEKKSYDKNNHSQLSLLDKYVSDKYLRIEFRMTGQKSIKRNIKSYASEFVELPIVFQDYFNLELSMAVLTSYWKREIKNKYISIVWKPEDFYEKVIAIKSQNPQINEKQLMQIAFMNGIIADRGIGGLRSTMGWTGKDGYKWSRYKKLLKEISIEDNRRYIIDDIDQQLVDFQSFREIPI